MAYHHQFNPILNDLVKLKSSYLKSKGLIVKNQIYTGKVYCEDKWSNQTVFKMVIDFMGNEPIIGFKELRSGKVSKFRLISRPSNLGKGVIWYFQCLKTNVTSRFVYLYRNEFLFRTNISNAMYECQTYSNYMRNLDKELKIKFGEDHIRDIIRSKGFQKYYKGKPTKRYKKYLDLIKYYREQGGGFLSLV